MKTRTALASALFLATAALLPGAPAQAFGAFVVQSHEHVDETYTTHAFGAIAGARDLRVVVRGNPTGLGQDAFEAAVVRAMNERQPGYQAQARFVAGAAPHDRAGYRVVMVFAGAAVSETEACRNLDGVSLAQARGRVHLTAVLCWNDERINSVHARIGAADAPAGAALDDLVAASMRTVFPLKWRLAP